MGMFVVIATQLVRIRSWVAEPRCQKVNRSSAIVA
jgi:hypothetical protein